MKQFIIFKIMTTAIQPRKAIPYSGNGSPVDNYFNPVETLQCNASTTPAKRPRKTFDAKNAQHKYIMSLCRQRNWVIKKEKWGEVADMEGAFATWLFSNLSPVKKWLVHMEPKEVSKIIIAMGGVVEHKYSK
jgi:hypothetical protein